MPKVNIYNSKYRTLSGTSRSEVYKKARREYNDVAHATKRQPYIDLSILTAARSSSMCFGPT